MLHGTELRDARKALGASQTDLASAAGVRRARVSEIENGSAILPGEEEKLLAGLGQIRADTARVAIAPMVQRRVFMPANEVVNASDKIKDEQLLQSKLLVEVEARTRREHLARRALTEAAGIQGTLAADVRRRATSVLESCAAEAVDTERRLAASRNREAAAQRIIVEAGDTDAKNQKLGAFLTALGPEFV